MSFAFLFLIYDNFVNQNIIKKFTKNQNIYIHPKYPDKVDQFFKPFIISKLVETEWAKMSIVKATLNLLEEAYKNENNKWFILLSQDTYPLYKFKKFKKKFSDISSTKSIFNLVCYEKNNNLWKSDQWWVLNRTDVEIILNNINKYKNKFDNIILNGAYDEYYFLSVLKWHNKDYEFINLKIMYTKWLSYTTQKSPVLFNYLLTDDIVNIKQNKSLFIRKILPSFQLKKYIPKNKLYIIYIGTETNQNNIIFNDNFDVILITSININLIKPEILKRTIYIYNILYKLFFETIIDLCNQKYILDWDLIIFTSEEFNMNNYNDINRDKQFLLPYDTFYFKNNLIPKINNSSIFYHIKDNNNKLAFCIKTKNLK